jgi:hypothetical protein
MTFSRQIAADFQLPPAATPINIVADPDRPDL